MDTLPTLRVVARTLARAAWARLAGLARGTKTLRVGVDIRPFYEPLTGVGWYLHHVLDELGRRDDVELVLFGDARVTDDGPALHASIPERARYSLFDLRGIRTSRFSRPITAAAFLALVWLEDCDLFFGANYFLPRLMDAVAKRRVITVHDLTYRRYPELLQQETLDNLNREMARAIAHADEIITVSEATRRDLLAFYDVDPCRAHAILSGASFAGGPAESSRPALLDGIDHFILFVSTVEPRKNLDVLVDAFERVANRGYSGHLVVVGRIGWKAESTVRRMRTSRVARRIRHLDYVDRADLAALYRHADVFVLPSLYEGFGLPILEAMASGTPVVAAASSSLPEVGGDAARYFPPDDPESLAREILAVVHDDEESARLVAAGRKRTREFDWAKTAEKTLAVFRRAAGAAT
jgi:glycosyltransferase involved in cell wall biosynthesis